MRTERKRPWLSCSLLRSHTMPRSGSRRSSTRNRAEGRTPYAGVRSRSGDGTAAFRDGDQTPPVEALSLDTSSQNLSMGIRTLQTAERRAGIWAANCRRSVKIGRRDHGISGFGSDFAGRGPESGDVVSESLGRPPESRDSRVMYRDMRRNLATIGQDQETGWLHLGIWDQSPETSLQNPSIGVQTSETAERRPGICAAVYWRSAKIRRRDRGISRSGHKICRLQPRMRGFRPTVGRLRTSAAAYGLAPRELEGGSLVAGWTARGGRCVIRRGGLAGSGWGKRGKWAEMGVW